MSKLVHVSSVHTMGDCQFYWNENSNNVHIPHDEVLRSHLSGEEWYIQKWLVSQNITQVSHCLVHLGRDSWNLRSTHPSPLSKIVENACSVHFLQLCRNKEYGDPHILFHDFNKNSASFQWEKI